MPETHIEFPNEDVRRGRFANHVASLFSPTEFTLEFGLVTPEGSSRDALNVLVQSRIIMTPQMFKIMVRHVSDALANYEKQFGEIELPKEPRGPPQKQELHYR
ncbi:MAG: DUF3467 domain-containing protein [Candidatus Micrarchaeia archaeon]